MENQLELLEEGKKRTRHYLEIELPQQRESLEKEMQEQKEGKKTRFGRRQELSSRLEYIQQLEVGQRRQLEWLEKEVAALREQRETTFKPQIEKLQKEIEKAKTAISTAMDKWIHNQDKFTCIAVFVISNDKSLLKTVLEECIVEKLALFPDHAKLVVTPSEWETIGTVPETLHVMYNVDSSSIYKFYSLMIEIFNKRRETLDLVSMMQELGRTPLGRVGIHLTNDNLSTLLRFQKTEEKAKAVALASSVGNKLIGVLNIKTVFKVVAGGITVVSISEVLSRWSTFDQLVTAFNSCVLPAGTGLVQLTEGCVCLTVRAETLSALTTLWNLYQDGTLETRLYNFFVTDEIRELAGGEEVEVNVTIEEQEYEKACLEFINEAQEAASLGDGGRIRRNSDSVVYCSPKEELPLSKLERIETELKVCKERIAVMEKEIEIFSLDLEARSPEEKATFFKQSLEGRKAHKTREAREMDESTDKPEISQRLQAKLMDPGKYAFVEKYLEDVQERHSVTAEASDSGLGTHAAASELGMEEISECFEALQLYDFAELLEKVRPRSLRPALSPEQIEQLRGSSDRPTKYHSNVAVLVVKQIVGGLDNVESDNAEKIEAFFKDLNSRNEVTIIASPPSSQAVRRMEYQLILLVAEAESTRRRLEIEIPRVREYLEKEMQEQKEGKRGGLEDRKS
ncbi:hypothetical protein OS493_025304 [Desmophyllum pertusum]|uniref:TRADD-like N-terminal domain-containing protein n=1 Tax=Desmophyllum pertusum TaxID=174260 RepID=A0A9W9ZA84_9CNID|nr:hypothetical protein OS493_025304 [Desmophyllum pertusum]